MARSIKKGPFVDSHLMKKEEEARRKKKKKKKKKNKIRATKKYIIFISNFYIIFVCEFSPTRTFHGHSGDRKTKIKGKAAP